MSAATPTTSRSRTHEYRTRVEWSGSNDDGTSSYSTYSRDYRVSIDGKPDLEGSADPIFRGASDRYNPEDLFLAAVSACHMLAYLALCAREGVRVVAYSDSATGTLVYGAQGGRFETVTLRPSVVVADAADAARALALHETAHERCFIAASSTATILHEAAVEARRPPARSSRPH